MWHLTTSTLREWLEKLLHIHDTPERTAAAFALGVGIGFSPFLGFHTLIGLILAFALNLNRVALLIGLYLHLPWFMGPYYAGVTALGAWITGTHIPPDLLGKLEHIWVLATWKGRWEALVVLARPLLLPFVVGGVLVGSLLGGTAFPLALAFLRARRRLHSHPHPQDSVPHCDFSLSQTAVAYKTTSMVCRHPFFTVFCRDFDAAGTIRLAFPVIDRPLVRSTRHVTLVW